MMIKRIGPLSCGKIAGTLYAILGIVMGGIFTLVGAAGAFAADAGETPFPFPMIFGAAAIVVFPVLYGCLGFFMALIGAWLYNVLAGLVGGIELDLQ